MQVYQNRKKSAKASQKSIEQSNTRSKPTADSRKPRKTAAKPKIHKFGYEYKKIEEFKSDSGSCQAQSISHVQKVLNTHSQTSHIRVDISCTDATETEQILLESGRQ